jgi:hypothetical protein
MKVFSRQFWLRGMSLLGKVWAKIGTARQSMLTAAVSTCRPKRHSVQSMEIVGKTPAPNMANKS